MSRAVRVLYLSFLAPEDDPWLPQVQQQVGSRHTLALYDRRRPARAQLDGVEAVIDLGGHTGTRALADAATSVRLWQILGTGFEHFDVEYFGRRRIPVAHCPGQFSAVPLAECAMMFILMLTRHWNACRGSIQARRVSEPFGLELTGRLLTVVGFGSSGIELTRRARAFGMRVAAVDVRAISQDERDRLGLEFAGGPSDLDDLLRESDFLSLHDHLNGSTHHLIDERRLRLMKRTAYVINVARGALIDQQALLLALREGRIAGAGLDVLTSEPIDPSDPLLSLPNVLVTPHVAGVTDGTARRRALCVLENIDRIACGKEPHYRVDLDTSTDPLRAPLAAP
ncbi:MAG: NAD(P)-dependent oxidoreductase [Vicinamibacteraceae bacterium]